MLPPILLKIFFVLGVFTVSFDILFVMNVGPNIRASQLFFLVIIFNSFGSLLFKRVVIPKGIISLLLWLFFIILFIPNSGFIPKGIGYALWLILNIAIIFSLVQTISNVNDLRFYISWYVYSFVFVASFGLIQFFGGLYGYGNQLLVETWWVPGILPRINGFSYEPSFFATYLLIGWVMVAYFLKHHIYLIPVARLRVFFLVMTLALCLSGSRLGLLFMLFWYLQYPIVSFIRLLTTCLYQKDFTILFISIATPLIAIYTYNVAASSDLFQALAFGVGLGGVSSHSISDRVSGFYGLIQIFMDSPIIGYSLGGLSYALGNLEGINVTNFSEAKLEGNGVFLEVLAASGIFGFIPFCVYIYSICLSPFSLAKKQSNHEVSGLLRALALALVFELAIIQPNQNILRPYLWLHIAILSAVYAVGVKLNRAEQQSKMNV
jgi:hypothetical protein